MITGATWLDIILAILGIAATLIGVFVKVWSDNKAKAVEQAKQDQDAEGKDAKLTDEFGKKVIDNNRDIKKKQSAMDGWNGPIT